MVVKNDDLTPAEKRAIKAEQKKLLEAKIKRITDASLDELTDSSLLSITSRLTKDEVEIFKNMNVREVRDAVDDFYATQQNRINTAGRIRAIAKSQDEGNLPYLVYTYDNYKILESNAKRILEGFAEVHPVGQWLKTVVGIGPIISANLIASFDIEEAPSAGHFISFAGLNRQNRPWLGTTRVTELVNGVLKDKKDKEITYEDFCNCCLVTQWKPQNVIKRVNNKGEKIFINEETGKYKFTKESIIKQLSLRPYNKKLLCVMWKIGESFMKQSNNPNCLYGKIYIERKLEEQAKNEALAFAEQAKEKIKRVRKSTEAYKWYSEGKLPPAEILARAKKKAVQVFINHFYIVMSIWKKGVAPMPYIFAYNENGEPLETINGVSNASHVHMIDCPNLEIMKPFFKDANHPYREDAKVYKDGHWVSQDII